MKNKFLIGLLLGIGLPFIVILSGVQIICFGIEKLFGFFREILEKIIAPFVTFWTGHSEKAKMGEMLAKEKTKS